MKGKSAPGPAHQAKRRAVGLDEAPHFTDERTRHRAVRYGTVFSPCQTDIRPDARLPDVFEPMGRLPKEEAAVSCEPEQRLGADKLCMGIDQAAVLVGIPHYVIVPEGIEDHFGIESL